MSLTRAEWLEMWKDVRTLEMCQIKRCNRQSCVVAIKDIKDKIQQVVGQLDPNWEGPRDA